MADNFSARAGLFGITTPTSVPTGPDAQGYQGSYRALQQGIDNSIPGNPGYADYAGLGGTASVAEVAKYSPVNMGGGLGANGAIQNPGYGMVPQVQRRQQQPLSQGVETPASIQANRNTLNYLNPQGAGPVTQYGSAQPIQQGTGAPRSAQSTSNYLNGPQTGGVDPNPYMAQNQQASGSVGQLPSSANNGIPTTSQQAGGFMGGQQTGVDNSNQDWNPVRQAGGALSGQTGVTSQMQAGGTGDFAALNPSLRGGDNQYNADNPVQQGNFSGNYGPGGVMTNGAGGIMGGSAVMGAGAYGPNATVGGDNQYQADNPSFRQSSGPRRAGGPSQNLFGLGARGAGNQQQFQGMYQQAPSGINAPANLANGAPDFFNLANQQSGYNRQNALFQNQMNNPNYYNPAGSQTRTQNPDGSWSVNQSLNPTLQQGYEQQNQLKTQLLSNAQQVAGQGALNYDNLGSMPQFNADGVREIPKSDALNLAITRNSVYDQQKQYLDPEFNQAQGDLENKLANQGITRGSEAFNREMDNFARTRQRAYGDARNSAIQAGGAEQSRLFGLGLQAHTTGQNDAMSRFNTGMMSRQPQTKQSQSRLRRLIPCRQETYPPRLIRQQSESHLRQPHRRQRQ